jgi:hypothetical protein
MEKVFVLITLLTIKFAQSQTNINGMSSYNVGTRVIDIEMNEDGSHFLIAINETIPKIVRIDASNSFNVRRIGEYLSDSNTQPYLFSKIYIVKDYLIASTNYITPTKVFNLTSYQIIGEFNVFIHPITGLKYLPSKDIIVFGTKNG